MSTWSSIGVGVCLGGGVVGGGVWFGTVVRWFWGACVVFSHRVLKGSQACFVFNSIFTSYAYSRI